MSSNQRYPLVDDLLWVVSSPPLIEPSWRQDIRLAAEDIDVDNLATFLGERASRRVGRYFEDLVHYCLLHHADVDKVRRGLQICDDGRTIGELDFVYLDAASRLIHLETAVKFYLYLSGETTIGSHYVGPNANDTLEKKVQRLRGHQLLLSDHPSARQEIAAEGNERIEQVAWVCGRIFYHPDQSEPTRTSPLLSDAHLRGTWIRESELAWFDHQPATNTYRVLRKPNWLSGTRTDDEPCSVDAMRVRLQTHFSGSGHPVMIGALPQESASTQAVHHMMVVSDTWPLQDERLNR